MIKNLTKILTSSYSGAGLIFFVQVLTANSMNVKDFGMIAASLSLVALFSPIIGFGLDSFIYKYSATNSGDLYDLLQSAKSYVFFSSFISIACFILFAESNKTYLMVVMLLSQFCLGLSLAILQIRAKYDHYSILSLCQGLIRLLLFSLVVYFYQNITLELAVGTYIVSAIIVLIVSICIIYLDIKNHASEPRIKKYNTVNLLQDSFPFGLGTLSFIIYTHSVIYFINKFDSPESAALFSVAYVFLSMTFMIPTAIFQKFLIPKLHVLVQDTVDLSKLFSFGNTLMFTLGICFTFIVYACADLLISVIYDNRYSEASSLLRGLTVVIFLRFISSNSAAYLMTGNYMNLKNKIMLTVAVVNVILMCLFLPIYGVDGAVYIIILCEVMISTAYIYYVKQKFFKGYHYNFFFGFEYKIIKGLIK